MKSATTRGVFIRQLHIEGFGQFHDLALTLGPGLNVLHGHNEAGKSTLFAFIRAVLFGFNSRKAGFNRYEPKTGGVMGGRLVLATPEGDLLISRVQKRKTDGDLVVRNAQGEEVAPARVLEALGGMSRELFEAVFSLTLEDLRDFERLSKEDTLSNALFVSGVPGARRVPGAVEALLNDADALFRPKGAAKPFNLALDRLKEVRAKLAASTDRPREYAAARAAQEMLQERLPALHAKRRDAELQVRRLETLAQLKPELERAREAELALADLGPTQALSVERLEHALEEERKAKRESEQREGEARQLADARAALESTLWSNEGAQALNEALSAANRLQELGEKLPQRQARWELEQQQWRAEAKDTGLQVMAVNTSAVARARLVELKARHEQGQQHLLRVEETRRELQAQCDMARAESGEAEAQLKLLPEVDVEATEASLAALHALAEVTPQLADARHRREALRAEQFQGAAAAKVSAAAPRVSFAWAWGLVAVLVLAPLLAALWVPAKAGIITAAALPLAGWLAWELFRRRAPVSQPPASVDNTPARLAEVEALLATLETRAGQLRRAGGMGEKDTPEQTKARLLARKQHGADRAQWVRELATRRQRREGLEQRLSQAGRECEEKQRAFSVLAQELETALLEAGLPKTLMPGAALEWVEQCSALQKRSAAAQLERAILDDDARRWGDILNTVRGAAQAVGLELPEQAERLLGAVSARVKTHHEKWLEGQRLGERLEALKAPGQAAAARWSAAREAVAQLLAQGHCENAEAFRLAAQKAKQAAALKTDIHAVTARVELALAKGLAAAREQLAAAEPLAETLSAAREMLAKVEREQAAALQERGELKTTLAAWENDGETRALRYEEGQLLAQLSAHAQKVATARMAAKLLSRAKEDFERHHQPQLLTRASDIFSQLTGGRYVRLFIAAGDATALRAVDSQGQDWAALTLSRGTQDQLFLAFRVALAESVSARQHALPMMVDDVLVNFDEARAQAAVHMFAALSKTNQTVVFSCHAQTRRWLEDAGAHSVAVTSPQQLWSFSIDANG
ncbi:MAG: AAA family ATPase [Myxococcaceae bacterium]|nr:AAA family ATPase [Myxococcaceae bacterium]